MGKFGDGGVRRESVTFPTAFPSPTPSANVVLSFSEFSFGEQSDVHFKLSPESTTTTGLQIEGEAYQSSWSEGGYAATASYLVVSPALQTMGQALAEVREKPGEGDEQMGNRMCIGQKCADTSLISRLADMSNARIASGEEYYRLSTSCSSSRRVTLESKTLTFGKVGFSGEPTVIAWISEFDNCKSSGKKGKFYTQISSTTNSQTRIRVRGWNYSGSANVQRVSVSWMAIAPEFSVAYRPYFPLAASISDPIASEVCMGKTCVGPAKWDQMLASADWRVEIGEAKHYQSDCGRSVTKDFKVQFANVFTAPPKVNTKSLTLNPKP